MKSYKKKKEAASLKEKLIVSASLILDVSEVKVPDLVNPLLINKAKKRKKENSTYRITFSKVIIIIIFFFKRRERKR